MATKKFLELQEFSDGDLVSELEKTEQEYQKLRFDHAIKGLDKPNILKEVRRDIARLQTEIRRRQVAAMPEHELAMRTRMPRKEEA